MNHNNSNPMLSSISSALTNRRNHSVGLVGNGEVTRPNQGIDINDSFYAFAVAATASAVSNSINPGYVDDHEGDNSPYSSFINDNTNTTNSSKNDEHEKAKRQSHREVEKKRRENINAGISKLASLIPGNEKSKIKVLNAAADHINELRSINSLDREKANIERMMLEQTLQDFTRKIAALENDKMNLEAEVVRLHNVVEDLREYNDLPHKKLRT